MRTLATKVAVLSGLIAMVGSYHVSSSGFQDTQEFYKVSMG